MQPIQQQGRRFPSRSSSHVLWMRRLLVSICLAFSTQQMNSLRASGVMSSHRASTFGSATSAVRKSVGILCTVPPEISFVSIYLFYMIGGQNLKCGAESNLNLLQTTI